MTDTRVKIRPMLFVDIDGVLNTYGGTCPPGYVEHDLFPEDDEPVRINPLTSGFLAELAQVFDLYWATAWTRVDRERLPSILPLPPFAGAAEMPPIPFDPKDKIPVVAEVAVFDHWHGSTIFTRTKGEIGQHSDPHRPSWWMPIPQSGSRVDTPRDSWNGRKESIRAETN